MGSYVDIQSTFVRVGFIAVWIRTFKRTDVMVDSANVVFEVTLSTEGVVTELAEVGLFHCV